MSDEDEADYEELPAITVNSAARAARVFAIPPAGEVAAQRARALACEAELRRLAELHALPAHSDSSGSEGEAALAAAVTALRVRAPCARRHAPPPLHELLRAAVPHVHAPRPLLAAYVRASSLTRTVLLETLKRLARCAPQPSERAEARECSIWLCLALCAGERRALGALRAARAAHAILEESREDTAEVLLSAVETPRARLQLADALRGAGARSAALADAVEGAAWAELDAAGALAPPERCARLQLAGRARARGLAVPRAYAPQDGGARSRETHPDSLQVLAATTKLQMLFPDHT